MVYACLGESHIPTLNSECSTTAIPNYRLHHTGQVSVQSQGQRTHFDDWYASLLQKQRLRMRVMEKMGTKDQMQRALHPVLSIVKLFWIPPDQPFPTWLPRLLHHKLAVRDLDKLINLCGLQFLQSKWGYYYLHYSHCEDLEQECSGSCPYLYPTFSLGVSNSVTSQKRVWWGTGLGLED